MKENKMYSNNLLLFALISDFYFYFLKIDIILIFNFFLFVHINSNQYRSFSHVNFEIELHFIICYEIWH